jgi:TetR/AcrR family transcriptional regulator, cholesterol catabolism regulator
MPTVEAPGSRAQRERRTRILDATVELASAGGFEAVQMRAVAERADVALGTLYRYFPSKIHLLVQVLHDQFAEAEAKGRSTPTGETTAHDRVMQVLGRHTAALQSDPHLTEALTRAFMSADASVADQIRQVEALLETMLTRAITDDDVTPAHREIARVIGDVWLATLVGWVTGRTSAADVLGRMDRAVRLLIG